jgi:hypothetical protein
MGIVVRLNGQPPPEVAVADIDLGSSKFWDGDDDVRDGAFATLRCLAPIAFFPRRVAAAGRTVPAFGP